MSGFTTGGRVSRRWTRASSSEQPRVSDRCSRFRRPIPIARGSLTAIVKRSLSPWRIGCVRAIRIRRRRFDRAAIVFKHPLPYLYLAPDTLGAAGIPYRIADALPLAAEPVATTVDLVLDAVETAFSRDALVALLRSPHLNCEVRLKPDTTPGDFRQSIFDTQSRVERQPVSGWSRSTGELRYFVRQRTDNSLGGGTSDRDCGGTRAGPAHRRASGLRTSS